MITTIIVIIMTIRSILFITIINTMVSTITIIALNTIAVATITTSTCGKGERKGQCDSTVASSQKDR
mgnify:CR=1 FL=1